MFFFPLANFLVCSQRVPCLEVSMCLPAPEGCTYSTLVHSNEQGKYGEIDNYKYNL